MQSCRFRSCVCESLRGRHTCRMWWRELMGSSELSTAARTPKDSRNRRSRNPASMPLTNSSTRFCSSPSRSSASTASSRSPLKEGKGINSFSKASRVAVEPSSSRSSAGRRYQQAVAAARG